MEPDNHENSNSPQQERINKIMDEQHGQLLQRNNLRAQQPREYCTSTKLLHTALEETAMTQHGIKEF